MAGARLHGDETTVPVLAKNKTVTGRLWTYVRDDRPFAGPDPPAALFYYSRNRSGEHPNRHLAGYAGILQADAYAGFGDLYDARRRPGPITEAACWAHGRRKFFVLADVGKSPLAAEAVRRIDYHAPRGLDRTLFLKLAACDWIRQHRNLLVTGPTGIGKSWISCALGHKACRDNLSVLYQRVPRLMAALAFARGDGRYGKLLRALARVNLLILAPRT
jgi:hypothetical protein